MWRLLADENFNQDIVHGVTTRHPEVDVKSVHEVGLNSASDPDILSWCAGHCRILLSHDRSTVPMYACNRVRAGEPMPGVIIVTNHLAVGPAVNDLSLLIACCDPNEFINGVAYLPL